MDNDVHKQKEVPKLRIMQRTLPSIMKIFFAKLLQKSEMRKDIVIELSYKGFG